MISNHVNRAPPDPLPPHSVEAEMCVIGAMMISGNDPATFASIRSAVSTTDFFQADHQILFDVICAVFDRCRALDSMIVREELVRRQILDNVGGLEYLGQILHGVPSAINGVHYAHDVREKATLRRLIAASDNLKRRVNGPMNGDRADEIARDFLADLHGVGQGRAARIHRAHLARGRGHPEGGTRRGVTANPNRPYRP
jgi:replicative DNA helicase